MNKETVETYQDENIQEVNQQMASDNKNIDEITRLKLKINNLLWEELPSETCIGDAESISCRIFTMIREAANDK